MFVLSDEVTLRTVHLLLDRNMSPGVSPLVILGERNVWALLALELLDLAIAVSARLRVAHIQLKSGLLGTEVEST